MFRYVKDALYKVVDIFFRVLPIYKKTVFFESFSGKYNDNPKYISDALHHLSPETRIIWSISSADIALPAYIESVKPQTMRYFISKNTAQVSVDNYIGSIFHYGKIGGAIINWLLRKKRKLNISTWHGTPLKKIGADVLTNKRKEGFYSSSSFLIAGCEYTRECLARSVYGLIPVRLTGTPRNDAMFEACPIDYDRFRLPVGKKICLYAPTYRDDLSWSGVNQLLSMDIDLLLQTLHVRFGGEWIFVFRVHHTVERILNDRGFLADKDNVFNGNIVSDMGEYLKITDLLITDYSGSIFDFALKRSKGKCILYTPDIEEYSRNPGLYMPLSDLPYPCVRDFDCLLSAVSKYDEDDCMEAKIELFLRKIGNVEDGKASLRIARLIVDHLYGGKSK